MKLIKTGQELKPKFSCSTDY